MRSWSVRLRDLLVAARRVVRRRPLDALAASVLLAVAATAGAPLFLAALVGPSDVPVRFTSEEPTRVEVAARDDDPRGRRWIAPAPSLAPLALPAGAYQARSIGAGRLGEAFDFDAYGPNFTSVQIRDYETRFCEPFETHDMPAVVDLGRVQALLDFTPEGIVALGPPDPEASRDALQELWRLRLDEPLDVPGRETSPDAFWRWERWLRQPLHDDEERRLPHVVRGPVDLDGDGTGDVVCAARHRAWVAAVSGATGNVLWFTERRSALATDDERREKAAGTVLDPPLPVGDVDGDGAPDLLTSFLWYEAARASRHDRRDEFVRKVELLSGRDGTVLWSVELGPEQPVAIDPFAQPSDRRFVTEVFRHDVAWGTAVRGVFAPQLVAWRDELHVAIASPLAVQLLDRKTGEPLAPPLPFGRPATEAPAWGDLDGDGCADLVTSHEPTDEAAGRPVEREHALVARSLARREVLWRMREESKFVAAPLIADLTGDGRPEVVVARARAPAKLSLRGWLDVECRNGGDGAVLWSRAFPLRISLSQAKNAWMLAGPDVDRDGGADLFIAWSAAGDRTRVEALAGRSGATRWRLPDAFRFAEAARGWASDASPATWWRDGGDGWPRLVLRAGRRFFWRLVSTPIVALSAGDGRVVGQGDDVVDVLPVDLDHDGFEELVTLAAVPHPSKRHVHVRRGGGLLWRRHGTLEPAGDLDGDGVREALSFEMRELRAFAGRSGRELWRRGAESHDGAPFSPPELDATLGGRAGGFARLDSDYPSTGREPLADFDGDGLADVLVAEEHSDQVSLDTARGVLAAASGRTGRTLRSRSHDGGVARAGVVDLDGDGRSETWSLDGGSSSEGWRRLSVDSSTLRWSAPRSEDGGRPTLLERPPLGLAILDCDGDGTLDFVLEAPSDDEAPNRWCWEARSGRDGGRLWRFEQTIDTASFPPLTAAPDPFDGPGAIGGLRATEFDGRAVLVAWHARRAAEGNVGWTLTALDARHGDQLWEWTSSAVEASVRGESSALELRPLRENGRIARLLVARRAEPQAAWIVDAHGEGRELSWPRDESESDAASLQESVVATSVVPLDVDQDGTDEVLWCDSRGLGVFEPGPSGRLRWRRESSDRTAWTFCGLLAAGPDAAPRALFCVGRSRSYLVALDPRDGRPAWSCARLGTAGDAAVVLGVPATETPPLVLVRDHRTSDVRQAAPGVPRRLASDAERGEFARERPSATTDPRALDDSRWRSGWTESRRPVESRDPDLGRPLPWIVRGDGAPSTDQTPWSEWRAAENPDRAPASLVRALVLRLALASVLIVLPGAYVARVATRRQFSLRQWLLLPLLVMIVLATFRMPATFLETGARVDGWFLIIDQIGSPLPEAMRESLSGVWGVALVYAPLVVGATRAASAIRARCGRRCAALGGAWLAASVVVAVWFVAQDMMGEPFDAGEYYEYRLSSAAGRLASNGFYLLSLWLLLERPGRWLASRLSARWKRRAKRVAS